MNFNEPAFDKAAKRLSDIDSSALSAAQEKLAKILGFKNQDAARRAFKRAGATTGPVDSKLPVSAVLASAAKRHWHGKTFRQTLDLLELLCFAEARRLTHGLDVWQLRAMDFLRSLLTDIFARTWLPAEVSADEIEISTRLPILEQRYQHYKLSSAPAPMASRGLIGYIENLPCFDEKKVGHPGRQMDETQAHHRLVAMSLTRGLHALRIIETLSADDEKLERLIHYAGERDWEEEALRLAKKIQDQQQFADVS